MPHELFHDGQLFVTIFLEKQFSVSFVPCGILKIHHWQFKVNRFLHNMGLSLKTDIIHKQVAHYKTCFSEEQIKFTNNWHIIKPPACC